MLIAILIAMNENIAVFKNLLIQYSISQSIQYSVPSLENTPTKFFYFSEYDLKHKSLYRQHF